MGNIQAITENDYPIEPIWALKSTLPSLLGLPITFFWIFSMGVMGFLKSNKESGQVVSFMFYLGFFLLFIVLPIPLHFFINILRRKNFHYSLDDKFLNLHQGILSKQNRQLPYGVIQNVIVQRGILDRIFNLSSLQIENASSAGGAYSFQNARNQQTSRNEMLGFQENLIKIPGLSVQNAEILKGLILERIKTNPIEEMGM